MTQRNIYLDNNATTPLDPNIRDVLIAELGDAPTNPSSIHHYGQQARKKLTAARRTVAEFLGVKPQEIVFTSSGTEALNMVIRGIAKKHTTGHIVTTALEHAAVYNTVKDLESHGYEVTYLTTGEHGAVTAEDVKEAMRHDTMMVVVMAVNNETGVKSEVEAIANIAEEAKVPFVVDAVASLGKEDVIIPKGVSAMCFSGHKIHAPKGVGMAYISKKLKISPLLTGGGQEHGLRSGTENVESIVAFAEAIKLLQDNGTKYYNMMELLRDRLEEGIKAKVQGVVVNGTGPRISNTTNLAFEGIDGETLIMNLDIAGVAVGYGAACSSGALEPSRVLVNMGLPTKRVRSSLRFSVSRLTTEEDVDNAVDIIAETVATMNKNI
ncbi:MAG: cysteine desulfurase [Waddliaceae bacterium]|nr:cysteine desulfurase [Waddliaceae bacterium]MBT3579312.1 cysteine desulfurase [Waddliaceae bacterium]MBT4445443.1 cysteine desulfurase [Waddliaceae bacterium]MBT6928568.1 cysteine desulfurase [Waddliaceae bacterium]MBT7264893.1 cysteine desulfurase [Waddliaceae bacterium]